MFDVVYLLGSSVDKAPRHGSSLVFRIIQLPACSCGSGVHQALQASEDPSVIFFYYVALFMFKDSNYMISVGSILFL